jgi:hypothetical protein
MRTLIFVFLIVPSAAVQAETFEERVVAANAVESSPTYASYRAEMFKPIGSDLASAVKECLDSTPGSVTTPFTLVADLSADGVPLRVEVKPKIATSACIAGKLRKLRFPAPPQIPARKGYPIVLNMKFQE